jgi:hypothetical protein
MVISNLQQTASDRTRFIGNELGTAIGVHEDRVKAKPTGECMSHYMAIGVSCKVSFLQVIERRSSILGLKDI